jgi:hypothetical protein
MIGTCHCAQLLVEMESHFLPRLAPNYDPSNLSFPSSSDYRHEPPGPSRHLCFNQTCKQVIPQSSQACSLGIREVANGSSSMPGSHQESVTGERTAWYSDSGYPESAVLTFSQTLQILTYSFWRRHLNPCFHKVIPVIIKSWKCWVLAVICNTEWTLKVTHLRLSLGFVQGAKSKP